MVVEKIAKTTVVWAESTAKKSEIVFELDLERRVAGRETGVKKPVAGRKV